MKHEHPAAPASGAVYVEFREQISQAGERDDVAGAAALVVAAGGRCRRRRRRRRRRRQVGDLPDAPGAEVQKPPGRSHHQRSPQGDVAAANSALRSSIEIVMTLWRRR